MNLTETETFMNSSVLPLTTEIYVAKQGMEKWL